MSVESRPGTFFALDDEWSNPEVARVAILPIPYEQTTSYGEGTASAPDAVFKASAYVELYDEELDQEIFRLPQGIATLPPIVFSPGVRDREAVDLIKRTVLPHLETEKMVVSVGGEHTIAVGTAAAYLDGYQNVTVLQLDAHSDMRESYEGSKYSHASAMARIYDLHKDIVHVGIRSQCREEADLIREQGIPIFSAVDIKRGRFGATVDEWASSIVDSLKENVYLTFDCDFLDPSVMPALGTPEPGGFDWYETITFLRTISEKRRIIGFDVNELAPIPGISFPQFTIAKLIYKLIGYVFSKRR